MFISFLLIAAVLIHACIDPKSSNERDMGIKELNRAISAIEDRREAEIRIIKEQNEMILKLSKNLDAANSDGMKQAIEKDISMKKLAVQKAEKNLSNQDVILATLYQKKDSLLELKE